VSASGELHVVFGSGPVGLAVVDALSAQGKRVRVASRSGARRGLPQAVLLRGVLPTPALWAAVVTVGWPFGWAVSAGLGLHLEPKWAVFGAYGSWAFQLVTGLTLAYLLRQRDGAPVHARVRGASV
jgi:hypothetical protein